ncbi:amino acid adenylation domain-containing protein [Nocardiopsis sp. L17-MgMaSL7]|uniref:amino acid adenylation domain-containing protein n=1 Tax=Nocardiopsis sp. L17-MgMaSL7 TaxID=1938893 RepID=UPI000D71A894|nr:non-ribosomal peptide synthetase [Nocardiopsis sp. L17-MgMaSL7]PWV57365.1 amino acid adenylation domain-containing protein [Nocardiopsis sp. L17-MgMaSL7]
MLSTTTLGRPEAVISETITGAFARTARDQAHCEAITDGLRTLTYGELDAGTDRIALALSARGLRPGQHVGVHLDRSLATYQLFLGILKAGLVVVPFNPAHPPDYKARMYEAAEPALMVVGDRPAEAPWEEDLPVADLLAEAAAVPAGPPSAEPSPDAPAFVLFTSGSTGVPKGVVIAHRGIARVSRHLTDYTPGPGDRFLQLAQPSFAASTTDIWTCLLRGGRLMVAPQEVPALRDLAELIIRDRTTVLNLPVGLFNLLVEHHPETVARARWVIVSGDFPSTTHLERALGVMEGALFNAFGCTENSALTAVHRVTAADLSTGEVPVGRPMPTVELSVRDEHFEECPPGRIGEFCIAGEGLALGYLNDRELTGEKFVRHGGRRLLRTGDLAKWTEDGEIVLGGRGDQMLKVRGYRVEPRHVEVTAEAFPGVARAVVQAPVGDGASERLVLWCTAEPGAEGSRVSEHALMTHLRERLPDYMVPTTVTLLDSFPLNANGKVDRGELRTRLASVEQGTERNGERPPKDRLAETVRSTLAAVMDRQGLGADEALLEAGVTSLHLIDLGSRLDDVVGVSLSPSDILDAGTVTGVAALVRARRRGGDSR